MWLWIGAIIAALGGLIALWPAPLASRRRALAVPRRRRAGRRGQVPAPQPVTAELLHERERERELA
jgi:hypothetical protein